MNTPKIDIFISYASADRQHARALSRRLEQEGWTVWWDRHIPPGQSFAKVLEKALFTARCVVVLWSNTSRSSDWVQNEAAEGKRRGILVPAVIEETSLPFEFRRIQAANLVGWEKQLPGNELDQFLAAIDRVLSYEDSSQVPISDAFSDETKRKTAEHMSVAETGQGEKTKSRWQSWGSFLFFTSAACLSFMMLFKALYPQTQVGEAFTTILILSVIAGGGLNFCWRHWRQAKVKK